LIFDFETFSDEKRYEQPYLCVSRLYNLKDIFKNNNSTVNSVKYQEKIFYGIECAKELFEYLTSGDLPLKTVCFAHNGSSFDFYFLLRFFYLSKVYTPSVIFKGSQLIQMIVKTKFVELRFIDSLNFIPFPLRKFSSLFGFNDSKTFFPYDFVKENKLEYVGAIPEKSNFCVNPSEQKEFDIFYSNELKRIGNGLWNLQEVSTTYCQQDVHVLFCGIFTYLKTFFEVTQINPFRFYSL